MSTNAGGSGVSFEDGLAPAPTARPLRRRTPSPGLGAPELPQRSQRARTVSYEDATSIIEEDVRMESEAGAADAAFLKATSAFMVRTSMYVWV